MNICFASHNANKIKELNGILSGVHQIYGLSKLGITEEIPETGETLEENSRIKAKYVYDHHHVPVFADDSGLLVEALKGEPNVYSARYAGEQRDSQQNMDLVLKNLGDCKNRKASFKTIITFIDEKGVECQFSGSVEGEITLEKRGDNGFGYDPIFKPNGYPLTFAELSSEIKNRISHRAQAVKKFVEHLRLLGEQSKHQ